MTWFEVLTGFCETSASQVRKNITVGGGNLTSLVNRKEMTCGLLETPSLAELRKLLRIGIQWNSQVTLWIIEGIKRALRLYKDWNLDVAIVSYHMSNQNVRQLVEQFP
jgi:hypothetical protein